MSEKCSWLHEQLERLPLIRFPFDLEQLSENGIYFFYEDEEVCKHGDCKLRIIRIGISHDGNFRSRIAEHFLFDENEMGFDATRPAPKDRSIFRKNIGRALLSKMGDAYLSIWNVDFTTRGNRDEHGHLRDIQKEKRLESEITRILREGFSFRFIIVGDQTQREELERLLIGTVARCEMCQPSHKWLGMYSPKIEIRTSGLWQSHHLNEPEVNEFDQTTILTVIARTEDWISHSKFQS